MYKQIYANDTSLDNLTSVHVEDIPDIDNRFLHLNDVLDWLDVLQEVESHDENICN